MNHNAQFSKNKIHISMIRYLTHTNLLYIFIIIVCTFFEYMYNSLTLFFEKKMKILFNKVLNDS